MCFWRAVLAGSSCRVRTASRGANWGVFDCGGGLVERQIAANTYFSANSVEGGLWKSEIHKRQLASRVKKIPLRVNVGTGNT